MSNSIVMVRRGNNIQRISAERLADYMKQGFDLVDVGGQTLRPSIPTDINVLKNAYTKHKARIAQLEKIADAGGNEALLAELEKHVKELEAENIELKKELAQVKSELANAESSKSIPNYEGTSKADIMADISGDDDDDAVIVVPPEPLPEHKPARKGRSTKK